MFVGGVAGLAGAFYYEKLVASPSGVVAALIAVVCAFLCGALGALIYSFLTVTLRANQNVTGLALTIFGTGGRMAELIRLALLNGAAGVIAAAAATAAGYEAAFAVLEKEENICVMLCDSGDAGVHSKLKTSVDSASAARREHIPAAAMIFCSRSFTAYPPGGGPPSPARRVGQSPSRTGRHDPPSRCRPAG